MAQQTRVPAVPGILGEADVRATAASIVAMQEADGAIPWSPGQHVDVWNHVEAAMALLVAGETAAAERAYAWVARTQRVDGSWPMKLVGGRVEDESGETNMSAYLAVGVWHHWLLRRDLGFVDRMWPVVRRGLEYVVGMQLPFGGIRWSQEWSGGRPGSRSDEAMLAGSSSIHQSLRAGVALADLVGDPQPSWELAGGRLGHAVREHRDLFADKSTFSMDWYYPVLGGAVRGEAGRELLAGRWDDFVVPGLGVRCVDTNPWVTAAETCELVMALVALGERDSALRLFADVQHLRHQNGSYWTGNVYDDGVFWPHEQTTYTAAAVILAADELAGEHGSPAAGIMQGDVLGSPFAELGLECGCELASART